MTKPTLDGAAGQGIVGLRWVRIRR